MTIVKPQIITNKPKADVIYGPRSFVVGKSDLAMITSALSYLRSNGDNNNKNNFVIQ